MAGNVEKSSNYMKRAEEGDKVTEDFLRVRIIRHGANMPQGLAVEGL